MVPAWVAHANTAVALTPRFRASATPGGLSEMLAGGLSGLGHPRPPQRNGGDAQRDRRGVCHLVVRG